jgi:hypothetical protein
MPSSEDDLVVGTPPPAWSSIQVEMILLERDVATRPFRARSPILGGAEPTLRDLLLRAGAAWLITWAGLMSVLRWGPV